MNRTILPNREAVLWLRKSRGWSQCELAKRAELDVRVVRKLESGRPVSPRTLDEIAAVFEVDVGFLVNPLIPALLNPRDFPEVIQGLITDAQKAELRADFGGAVELLKEAVRKMPHGDQEKRSLLNKRRAINAELRDLQRTAYKGTQESQIGYFLRPNRLAFAPKAEVHKRGLLHPTVILLFKSATGDVAWYERTEEQQFAGKRDFFGGHVLKSDKSPKETAMREATEEVHLYAGAIRIPFRKRWFRRIGRDYEFEWESPENNERSTVFVVELLEHPALSVTACDEDFTGHRIVNIPIVRFDRLSILAEHFARQPQAFADGAARVLKRYRSGNHITNELKRYFS